MQNKKAIWFSLLIFVLLVASVIILQMNIRDAFYAFSSSQLSALFTGGSATDTAARLAGVPTLEALDQVTQDAASEQGNGAVPNGWGSHKDRIVRTSGGDLFMIFIGDGADYPDYSNRTWHLMHLNPQGRSWVQVADGNAGQEPVNMLVGPHDVLHVFTWPGTSGKLVQYISKDLGRTFVTETIAGAWESNQGYAGCGINANGDMVVVQTGADVPGIFRWAYYAAAMGRWSYHENTLNIRHTYTYVFPGYHNDLTLVAMRDALRPELGYPSVSGFNYIFNAISYYYISDVHTPTLQERRIVEVPPGNDDQVDITYLTDAYMDIQGRTHVLYNNYYAGETYHAILAHGNLIKNVPLASIDSTRKARITQDTQGHFYIIATSSAGDRLNIYPGTVQDTDGTQLQTPIRLDISAHPTCNDYDLCHSPTFTVPRVGVALSNTIDGVYGNYDTEIHFRVNLHGPGDGRRGDA